MKPLAACSIALAIASSFLVHCTSPPSKPVKNTRAGSDRCASCHEQEARYCAYGPHRTLECEQCHGPGLAHAEADGGDRPGMNLGGPDLCLSCHKQSTVSTIESFEDHLLKLERDHRVKLDRSKSGTECVYCHDPHLLE